jgi:hypothetical protein
VAGKSGTGMFVEDVFDAGRAADAQGGLVRAGTGHRGLRILGLQKEELRREVGWGSLSGEQRQAAPAVVGRA